MRSVWSTEEKQLETPSFLNFNVPVGLVYVFINSPVQLASCLQDVKYLAISGFFFLRFFAPAILTPKLFQLRDQHADTRTSRTLLLLAKVQLTTQTQAHIIKS